MRIFADISSARAYNNIVRAISGYPGRYPPIPGPIRNARLGNPLCCGDAGKMSETRVKIIKNEIRCRDDTVPKNVDTRSHWKVWLRAARCHPYILFHDFYTCKMNAGPGAVQF